MSRSPRNSSNGGAPSDVPSRRGGSDAGDTLIEVLLALVVLALAALALIIAFSTSISASAEHRRLATVSVILDSVSQEAISGVNSQLSLFACAEDGIPTTTSTFQTAVPLSILPAADRSQYSATITQILWWNGTTFSTNCTSGAPEEITVTLTNTSTGATYQNTFVVDFPLTGANTNSGSAPATQLVFSTEPSDVTSTNPTTYGEAGAAFATQPVVAVENADGVPVSTDLSPVLLSIYNDASGAVLSGCSGNENPGGVVTFSNCNINNSGTYQLVATDGNLTATSTPFTVGANGAFLVFTTEPVAGTSGSKFTTEPVVTVEINNGVQNVTDTSWVGTITLGSSGGVLSSTCSGTVTAAMDGVWTAPSTCTFEGAYYFNPSNGVADAAPYVMTASGSSTNSPPVQVVPATSIAYEVMGPGSASQLIFTTQPTGATGTTAATTFAPFAVTLEDAFGNVVYNSTVSVTLSISSGALNNCTSKWGYEDETGGVDTFTGCYGTVAGNGLTITAKSSPLTQATSNPFNITGPAYQLVFTAQPVAGVSGSSMTTQLHTTYQFQVTVEDSSGNTVTSSTAAIALTSDFAGDGPGGSLQYCTSLTAVAGVVNVTSCTFAGLVGTEYTMTATSGTLQPATSADFSPTGPGVATQVVFTTQPAAGAAGSPLVASPVAKIEDSGGNVVTSSFVTVTFAATGGTLSCPTYNVIAVNGVANLQNCTFGGVVGTEYQLTASSTNLTTGTSANFTPSGPGPAAQVLITASSTPNPPPASSLANIQLTLQLEDAWGNMATNGATPTSFSLSSTSSKGYFASILGASGTLGAAGIATIPANEGSVVTYYGDETAGTPTITAENTSTSTDWGSTVFNIVPAAPAQVALSTTCGMTLASGNTCTVTATIEDQFGNAETTGGSGVGFAEGAGSTGSITLTGQTSSGGTSTITVTGVKVGAVTVNTTAPYAGPSPVSFNVTTGAPSKIAISAGANQSATVAVAFTNPLSALVSDVNGNPVAGATVTFTAPASGASGTFLAASSGSTCLPSGGTAVASCTATTNASGIATSLTFQANTTAGSYNVAVTSPGTTPNPLNFPETNTPTGPTHLVFTTEPPATTTAGTTLTTFKVSVEDQYGNVETGTNTGYNDSITISSACTLTGTLTATASGGVATFSAVTITSVGTCTLTATDNSRTLAGGPFNSTSITVSPGTPNKLVFTTEPPATTTAGTTLTTFKVSVEDQYGDVETGTNTGYNDSITISSACTLTGTLTATASGGVATFSAVTITKGTTCTLTATDNSRTLAGGPFNSTSITVSPGTPNKLVFTTEPPATTTASTTLTSFAVSVEDQYGDVETGTNTGYNDSITISSACTLTGTLTATASGGVATFSAVTITKGTTCTLTATDNSRTLAGGPFNSTSITVTPTGPTHLVFTTEPPATTTAGTTLTSFAVSVEDQYGNVETGTNTGYNDSITISSACTLTGTLTATASGGVATFSAVTITSVGTCTLTATDNSRTLAGGPFNSTSITVSPGTPNKLVFTTEPPATTTAGTTLTSFAVSVEDQYGNVETGTNTGYNDSITISSACTLTGTLTATASGGVATFSAVTITKGTTCTLTATDNSRTLAGGPFNSTSITVTPTGPTHLVFTTEPPATTTAGTTLTSFAVSVEDQYGDVETGTNTGYNDSITISSACTLTGTLTATASGGVATFSAVTITSVGTCTLTATDNSRTLAGGPFNSTSITVSPGTPNKLVFTTEPPATTTAGTTLTSFAVSVEDQYGDVETGTNTGYNDSITISSACTLTGTLTATASGGVATFSAVTITKGTTCTLTATDNSRTLAGGPFNSTSITVTPTGPTHLVFTTEPPATTTAGTTLTSFAVSVEDQYGDVETGTNTGYNDSITISSACTLTGTLTATASGGVATFSAVTITKGTTCTLTATDNSRTLAGGPFNSTSITVTPTGPTHLVFTTEPPPTIYTGLIATFAVSVEDQYGNVETGTNTGYNDSITISSACTLTGTLTATASGGVATFSAVTITSVGICTLTATDNSRTLAGGPFNSTSITVSPGTPNKLVFTTEPPATTTAGTTLTSFAVSVEDQYGNVETGTNTGYNDSITISSACTLTGTLTATASGGVATFSAVTITKGTTCTLTATDNSRTLAGGPFNSTSITVTPTGPTHLVFTTEPPATTTAGTTLTSFAVSVEDQYGNVETGTNTGYNDSITISSACTLTGTLTATASGGVATFSAVTITSVGTCTLTATDNSRTLAGGPFNSTSITVSPGTPNKLVFTTEPPATTTAGTTLTTFKVSVEDQYGDVETGTNTGYNDSITISSACTLTGTLTATASGGVATFSAVTITKGTTCTLTATDNSRTLAGGPFNSTSITVTAAGASQLVFVQQPSNVVVNTAMTPDVTVQVEDQYGNVVADSGATVTLALNQHTSHISGNTAVTSASGLATFTNLQITEIANGYTLTGTGGGLTGTGASNTFNVT